MKYDEESVVCEFRKKLVGGFMPFVSHVLRIKEFCENANEPFFPKLSLLEVCLDKGKNRLVSTLTAEFPMQKPSKDRSVQAMAAKSDFSSADRKNLLSLALSALVSREKQIFRTKVNCRNVRPVKSEKWVEAHEIHLPLPEKVDFSELEKQLKKLKGISFKVVE